MPCLLYAYAVPSPIGAGRAWPGRGDPESAAKFLAAANTLFDNALKLPEIGTTLAEYGYHRERLEAERARIAEFDQAREAHQTARGDLKAAIQNQATAVAALERWMGHYRRAAKIALAGKPELLKKLGFTLLTPAERAAATKAAAAQAARQTVEEVPG